MSSSYRRVPQRDGSGIAGSAGSSDSLEANVTQSRSERLQDKLVALAWVILAFLVARWTKFFGTLWSSDSDANRSLLRVAALGLGIVTSLVLYLSLYLPKIKGIDSSAWNVYCPRVIPTMAAVGVTSYLIFLRATWPVWGFLAPLVSGTQFMGILMALHFVPAMNVC